MRSVGHIRLTWDSKLHSQVGKTRCGPGESAKRCPAVGYIRHLGHKFSAEKNKSKLASRGLPITANPNVVGMTGGFGWLFQLQRGAPRHLHISEAEIDPSSVLLLHIPYPRGTVFRIVGKASCRSDQAFRCQMTFRRARSVAEVRDGPGNLYHVHRNGVLTIRVVQSSPEFVGNPRWVLPDYDTPGRHQKFALPRFERNRVRLPMKSPGAGISILARKCGGNKGAYCKKQVVDYDPNVCPKGFAQVAYDTCCHLTKRDKCIFADGRRTV